MNRSATSRASSSVSRLVRSESRALLRSHETLMRAVRTPGKNGRKLLEEEALTLFVRASSLLGRLEQAIAQKEAPAAQSRSRLPRKGSARGR